MNQAIEEKVVVAMSGGVDSSAAAIMLSSEGYDVVGVAMQVWDYRQNGGNASKATCCAPADFDDARDIAEQFSFPFYVFDFEDSFHGSVIQPFVDSYLKGETPNPCLECNRKVKFKELRARAKAFGATKVATGHYAQIKTLEDGTFGLFTGRDQSKDQSYFLYMLSQEDLQTTLFPVGGKEKQDVRTYLLDNGVSIAQKPESQDICFVSGAVSDFVEKVSGTKPAEGAITRRDGSVVGTHDGIHHYTVGQRKGLGLTNPDPLYVLSIDESENLVQVGTKDELQQKSFSLRNVNWISGEAPKEETELLVKLRYRHPGVKCHVTASADKAELTFVDGWAEVSPGQAAVFYSLETDSEGDRQMLGGGTIEKTRRT
jgi:tRNA-specific 2-thiouridylase